MTVVNDTGPSVIAVADGELDSGESVRLYDVGDAVSVRRINAPTPGLYSLAARVRSGGETGRTVFWPAGYEFKLNGETVVLEGDLKTVSERDSTYGGCHWGTMQSKPLKLSDGPGTLLIAAKAPWAVLDYVELLPAGDGARAP